MLLINLIGAILLAATVVMHAIGMSWWVRGVLMRHVDSRGLWDPRKSTWILLGTVWMALALHILEIILWAVALRTLVPAGQLETFEKAIYFSFVTFTTLGYGDITLSEGWRLLTGIEALNGILLIGWTTASLFAVVQRSWQSQVRWNE
jgi:hypothetical protein